MLSAKKVRVLILCTGNSARSQMAEGILRKMAGGLAEVHSAGIRPAREIHPLAQRTMEEKGVDLSGQYPKNVAQYAGQNFDIIITVCDQVFLPHRPASRPALRPAVRPADEAKTFAKEHCPFFPGQARRLHWSLDDPAQKEGAEGERLAAFRKTAAELTSRLREIMPLIEKQSHPQK